MIAIRYTLCNECATAILNDDYSGLSDEPLAMARQFAEDRGMLAYVDQTHPGGYWRCDSCQYDILDVSVVVEMV